MKKSLMVVFLVLMVVSATLSQAAQISLMDGSFFTGEIKTERFRLKTGFGELTPSISDLKAIEGQQVSFTDGNSISGELTLPDGLTVDTPYGMLKLEIGADAIHFIDFTGELNKSAHKAEVGEGKALIALKDGTRIIGEISNLDLTVKTKYGNLRPPLSDVAAITANSVTVKDGNTLNGDVGFGVERWVVKTNVGTFTFNFGAGDIVFVDFTGKFAETGTKTKQPELEKEKAAEFFDNFDKGPNPNWRAIYGNWTMANGMYTVMTIESDKEYATLLDGKVWTNFVLTVDVKPGDTYGSYHSPRYRYHASVCPRMLSEKDMVCFQLFGDSQKFYGVRWYTKKNGEFSDYVGEVGKETSEGKIVHVKIEVQDNVFTADLDGSQISQFYDSTFSSSSIGLGQWYDGWSGAKVRVAFDNLKITPLE